MKKSELKKRIEDGFSELSPDLFEAVYEECQKQDVVRTQAEAKETSGNGKFNIGRFPRYALSMCASLAIICLCIFGVLGHKEKTVYMVLDINPSIQVEVNEAHQVMRLKGLNQDGKDVVKELKWKKKGTVQELLDVLIQDVVEKSYLRENGGILVTLAARDKCICENLERTLGEGIDRKLTELKVSGVTTAFQEAPGSSEREGRKLLEAELTKSCGLDEEQVQQMSVMELIRYCHDYTSVELKLTEASKKEWADGMKSEEKPKTADTSLQEGVQETPGDSNAQDTERKPDDQKANPQGTKEDSSEEKPKDGEEASFGDNEDIEGNAKDKKPDKQTDPAGLEEPTQNGESIPTGSGTPIQNGSGESIEQGNVTDQPNSGDKPQSGSVLEKPEGGTVVTPGNSSGGPDSGDLPETGDVPQQPGSSGEPEPGDKPGELEGSDMPQPGLVPGKTEDGELPEMGTKPNKPEKSEPS